MLYIGIPEVLQLAPLRTKLTVERAHRIGPRTEINASSRMLIMKFLNYKDKEMVVRAAKTKRQVLYMKEVLPRYGSWCAQEAKTVR